MGDFVDATTGYDSEVKTTNNAAHVNLRNSGGTELSLPENAETWYVDTSYTIAATTTDNAVIGTTNDVSIYNYHLIENTSATDGVTVQVSVDGTNFVAVDIGVFILGNVTDSLNDTSIPAGSIGALSGKFRGIRFLKNGTTNEAPACRVAHGVV